MTAVRCGVLDSSPKTAAAPIAMIGVRRYSAPSTVTSNPTDPFVTRVSPVLQPDITAAQAQAPGWTYTDGIEYVPGTGSFARRLSGALGFDQVLLSSDPDYSISDPAANSDPGLIALPTTGFQFRASGMHRIAAGLTTSAADDDQSGTNQATFAVQLNQFGQIIVVENGIVGRTIGNYLPGSSIAILVSREGSVKYYSSDSADQLQLAYTSTVAVTFPLRAVMSLYGNGDVVGAPSWMTVDDWCQLSVCRQRSCYETPTCSRGLCVDEPSADTTSCDDGDPSTVLDRCTRGTCAGSDPCDIINCGESLPCRGPPRCVSGACFPGLLLGDGTDCDDGDVGTAHDSCAVGFCEGIPVTAPPSTHPTPTPTTVAPTPTPTEAPATSRPTPGPTAHPITSAPTPAPATPSPTSAPIGPCDGVVCADAPECYTESQCRGGTCYLGVPVDDNVLCDDGSDDTFYDSCTAGICAGVDVCAGVACPSTSSCTIGVCSGFRECNQVPVSEGTVCDDNDPRTVGDRCDVDGECLGVDLCIGVTCTAAAQCYVAGECIRGVCSNPIDFGASCDDRNLTSINDQCNANGECIGLDPCEGVECPETNCFLAGQCLLGDCIPGAQKPPQTDCDDGILRTSFDQCDVDGHCVGVDLCVTHDISCPTIQCHLHSVCLHGRCLDGTPLPHMFQCDDADPSTDDDGCVNGVCQGTPNLCYDVTCVNPDQCTLSSCDPASGACVTTPKPDGSFCDDANIFTTNDGCLGGVCQGVNLCDEVTCATPPECQLFEPSFVNGCFRGQCMFVEDVDGSSCNDGDPLTENDVCSWGACSGVDPCIGVTCPVVDNSCTVQSRCVSAHCTTAFDMEDDTLCDDGNNRTEDDRCLAGRCSGIDRCLSTSCGTSTQCDIRSCLHGECSQRLVRDDTPCDDENPNTVGDKCESGVCRGFDLCTNVVCTAGSHCHDPGTCTMGECSPDTVKPVGTSCDDGDNRTIYDVCARGVCAGRDLCNGVQCPADEQCVSYAPCFRGDCVQTVHTGSSCDDGDDRTQNDECQSSGQCQGVDLCVERGVVCPDAPQCYVGGGCLHGECSLFRHADNGSPCDDGRDETEIDSCNNGRCDGINLCLGVDCGDSSDCFTAGQCSMGECSSGTNAPDGHLCDDGNSYTDLDTCSRGGCRGIYSCAPACRSANIECEVTACRNTSCVQLPRPDGYMCNDNDDETVNDQCRDGACVGVDLCDNVECPAPDQCHAPMTCSIGRCSPNLQPDGFACDDNNSITINDACQGGACNGIDPCEGVVCAAETQCEAASICSGGVCAPAEPKVELLPCNDLRSDTYADACHEGQCAERLPCLGACVAFGREVGLIENIQFGLTRNAAGSGWAAFAVSQNAFEHGMGVFSGIRFQAAQDNKNFVVGLGYGTTMGSMPAFQATTFALFFSLRGTILLYESGRYMQTLSRYQTGDEVEIFINVDGRVVYRSATWSHTSTQPPPDRPLRSEVSIYDYGASVDQFFHINRQAVLCEDVECPSPSQCHAEVPCAFGVCPPEELLPVGTICDDSNPITDNDRCRADGTCAGTDLCIGVECPASPNCESPPVCSHGRCEACNDLCAGVSCASAAECREVERCDRGECLFDPFAAGTSCDDGNSASDADQCDGEGSCAGTDYCDGIVCPAATQCQASITCSHGQCEVINRMAGHVCDDGVEATADDVCDGSGGCAGRDYCIEQDVVCSEPTQCQLATSCFHGECLPFDPRQDGTRCDDGDPNTDRDMCTNGVCSGVDLCVVLDVECGRTQCSYNSRCQNGACVDLDPLPENTACDDNDNRTVWDRCVAGYCGGIDLCDGVTCPQDGGNCREENFCLQGDCFQGSDLSDRTSCDDGDPITITDQCTAGMCQGIDLCDHVVCPPLFLDPCLRADSCVLGECNITRTPIGGDCDDGDDLTDFDVCDVFGTCAGRDLCVENSVECNSADQCHLDVTCANGECAEHPPKQDQTPCDDGDSTTIDDVCRAGVCEGANPCDLAQCPQVDQCHQPSVCAVIHDEAVCSNLPVSDGTVCDDENINTRGDVCHMGRCSGTAFTCQSSSAEATFTPAPADCPAFNKSQARWAPAAQVPDAACTCFTAYGSAFSETTDLVINSAVCAQLICSGGGFNFERCDYHGVTVSQGTWGADGDDTVRVPYAFVDTICGAAFTDSSGAPPVPTSTSRSETGGGSQLPRCAPQTHIISWGLGANGIQLSVHTGDTVTWSWSGVYPLNARSSNNRLFHSGPPAQTGTFSHVFDEPGTYAFRSDVISDLRGDVIVSDPHHSSPASVLVPPADFDRSLADALIEVIDGGSQLDVTITAGEVVAWQWVDGNYYVDSNDCISTQARPAGALFSSRQEGTTLNNEGRVTFVRHFAQPGTYTYHVRSISNVLIGLGYVTVTVRTTPSPTATVTEEPATTLSPVFDLLAGAVPSSASAVQVSQGISYYRMDGETVLNVPSFPVVGNLFSFSFIAALDRGSGGYLFTVCDSDGGRYAGLYASAHRHRLTFYYQIDGSSIQRATHFDIELDDGEDNRILVVVDGTRVSVDVQGPALSETASASLVGPVATCRSDTEDCHLLLGGRTAADGGTAYRMSGSVYAASLYHNTVGELLDSVPLPTITPAPTAGPANMLADVVDAPGISHLGDGSVRFDGTSSVSLDRFPEPLGNIWSLRAWVKQTVGTSGYIFAKTDASGAARHLALYSSVRRGLIFYYTALGRTYRTVFNAVVVGDGLMHQIMLLARARRLVLVVDTTVYEGTMVATPSDDCSEPSSECFFHIGQRMSASGGAHRYSGVIYSLTFWSAQWLRRDSQDPHELDLLVSVGGSPVQFDGLYGHRIAQFRAIEGTSFSLSLRFTALAGSRGYLVAKSNAAGDVRHYALYGNADSLQFYYRAQGDEANYRSAEFQINAFDGAEHTIRLAVSDNIAQLHFDQAEADVRTLVGRVEDCGPPDDDDCVLYIGQRAQGYPFTGTMAVAKLFYDT